MGVVSHLAPASSQKHNQISHGVRLITSPSFTQKLASPPEGPPKLVFLAFIYVVAIKAPSVASDNHFI